VEKFPHLRATICEKLISTLPEIKSGKVFRGILWILGEYVESVADIQSTMRELRKVLGEIPILASEQRLLDEAGGDGDDEEEKEKPKTEGGGRPKVLADGTYATETAYTSAGAARLEAVKAAAKPPLRSESRAHLLRFTFIYVVPLALILGGDFFTGSVLAAALTKLVLRFDENTNDKVASNTLRAEVRILVNLSHCSFTNRIIPQSMLIMTSIIRVGQSKFVTVQIDEDSNERIMNCIQTLSDLESQPAVHEVFLEDTKTAYSRMLGAQEVGHIFGSFPEHQLNISFSRNEQRRRRNRRQRKLLQSRLMISFPSDNSRRRPQMRAST